MDGERRPEPPGLDQHVCLPDRWRGLSAAVQTGNVAGLGGVSLPALALDSANPGTERLLRESTVVWDCNFSMAGHQLHIPALADFLREVRGYLDSSTLLISTEKGEFRTSGSGADFDDEFLELWQTAEGDQVLLEELLSAWALASATEQGVVPAEE